MINYLSVIGELIAIICSFLIAFACLKKNREYIGNRLFAIAFIIFGVYASAMLTSEFATTELVVQIAVRIGLAGIIIGTTFFWLAMQVFLRSSAILKQKLMIFAVFLGVFLAAIVSLYPNLIIDIQFSPTMMRRNLVMVVLTGLFVYTYFIHNALQISKGIKNISEQNKAVKDKLMRVRLGQILAFGTPTFSIFQNIFMQLGKADISGIFAIIQYSFLAVAVFCVGTALWAKSVK